MLAGGLCSARRRGRTLGLPADWTLRSRDTDGLTRCPFRLKGGVRGRRGQTPGLDDLRARCPARRGRLQSLDEAVTNVSAARTPLVRPEQARSVARPLALASLRRSAGALISRSIRRRVHVGGRQCLPVVAAPADRYCLVLHAGSGKFAGGVGVDGQPEPQPGRPRRSGPSSSNDASLSPTNCRENMESARSSRRPRGGRRRRGGGRAAASRTRRRTPGSG